MKKMSIFLLSLAILLCSCGASRDASALNEAIREEQELRRAAELEQRAEEARKHDESLRSDIERGLLLLVNRTHPLSEDYVPEKLTRVKYVASNRSPVGWTMCEEAADAFNALSEAAAAEGHEIVVTTAYRSYSFQSTLYNNYVASYGQAEADTFSARPGTSEHQSGLCADVSSPSVGYRLERNYNEYPEGAWLRDHAHEYGFIIRFPPGREETTGYIYEPWHIRYVGLTAAKEIYEQDTTLEEYVAALENYGFFA